MEFGRVFDGAWSVAMQTLVVCVLLVLGLSLVVRRELAAGDALVPPEGPTVRNLVEVLFEGVVGLMRDTIGPTWPRYVPLVGTLGIFILVIVDRRDVQP